MRRTMGFARVTLKLFWRTMMEKTIKLYDVACPPGGHMLVDVTNSYGILRASIVGYAETPNPVSDSLHDLAEFREEMAFDEDNNFSHPLHISVWNGGGEHTLYVSEAVYAQLMM
ncbi:MAG: hypothetical protein WAX89_07540 [Alphaproteobacteria bacterium]